MRLRTGLDILEYELRQEQAATIGRLARELRDALDALDTFDPTSALLNASGIESRGNAKDTTGDAQLWC
jgi:hypothetical protein